jgi:hypothetical protein
MARAGERERFVRDFFKHFGADPEGDERGPLRIPLTKGLKQRLRVKELTAIFKAEELDDQPDGQLMVPGNPVFDRIIATARRFGGVSRRYQRTKRSLLEPEGTRAAIGAAGADLELECGPPRYDSSFLFTFRVAFRAIESFDEIHAIMATGTNGRYQEGNGFFRGLNLAEEPEPDLEAGEPVDVGDVLAGALDELEQRIGRSVERFVSRAEAQLTRERERLQQFFTDLIEEEKARMVRRKEQAPAVGAVEHKLEWVERIERENRLFAPKVTVSLLGLEEIRVPVRTVAVRQGSRALTEADLDLATGELIGVRCTSCGADLGEIRLCGGEHLVCTECLEVCALCTP